MPKEVLYKIFRKMMREEEAAEELDKQMQNPFCNIRRYYFKDGLLYIELLNGELLVLEDRGDDDE